MATDLFSEENPHLQDAVAEGCGCDPDLILADVVKIENSLFKSASVLLEEDRFPVLVETRDGTLQEIDSFSTLTSTGTPRTVFYLFCPDARGDGQAARRRRVLDR
ncbi:hypothetical protein J2129_000034 [Methanofollis sp. W23]|uniref:hypothetical protein n=1 Tax=Methanofollis sp. W23 TaxID=2817849 RepID=UPI001AEB1D08|nr:hypothetical protein [Methanofollis sp. W23]MBP2144580.1 hypothetical protein [Methanofollis sp. W23]